MNPSKGIDEHVARIQDNLAEIVTKDLIAGKVTSLRDAPRIVGIGRAIAKLDDVAGDVAVLQELVEDLAATNPVVRDMGYVCVLCREEPAEWDDIILSEHGFSCPRRRAVEWIQVHSEFEEDVERFAAGEELGDPLQATLTRAVDEAWAREEADVAGDGDGTAEQQAADLLADAEQAYLADLVRERLAGDTGMRYTLGEVCEILGVSLDDLDGGEEE